MGGGGFDKIFLWCVVGKEHYICIDSGREAHRDGFLTEAIVHWDGGITVDTGINASYEVIDISSYPR